MDIDQAHRGYKGTALRGATGNNGEPARARRPLRPGPADTAGNPTQAAILERRAVVLADIRFVVRLGRLRARLSQRAQGAT